MCNHYGQYQQADNTWRCPKCKAVSPRKWDMSEWMWRSSRDK